MARHAGGTIAACVSRLGAIVAAMAMLLAPALWNRYPLLQYDTGGYLARWYEGYLVPSRSTVFGLFLHAGEGLHFWPVVLVQAALTLWVVTLALRACGLGKQHWRVAAIIVALSLVTALPVLASALLTDIFAGLAVLALYLLVCCPDALGRAERIGLFALIAFSAATHSATLAILLALLIAGALAAPFLKPRIMWQRLMHGAAALATGAAMLFAANFALSGTLSWTPGGFGIAFGRMLEDGIVKRYLDEHCPDARLRLCPYRNELPRTADEFLWSDSVFNRLGRFTGMAEEMRFIVLNSLAAYPGQQIAAAARALIKQFGLVATGHGMHDQVWHTYGIIKRFIPGEVPAMNAARQQHGELAFDTVNRIDVPVAFVSLALMLAVIAGAMLRRRCDDAALLAATATLAIVANAAVCGILSGPHDRYGARIAWIATFACVVAIVRSAKATAVARPPVDGLESA